MKKIIILILFISVATGAFWASRQFCPLANNVSKASFSHFQHLSVMQQVPLKDKDIQFQTEAIQRCTAICQRRLELLEMMSQPDPDRQAIENEVEAIGQMQIELEKKMAAHILDIKKTMDRKDAELYMENIRKELNQSMQQMEMK